MNRQQAIEYDLELSDKLQQYARKCGENEELGKRIVNNFIEFLPENEIKNMIFLDGDPTSYKLGNVRIDLKKAMLAGVEFAASVSTPESIFNYIQLLIISVLFIKNVTRQELNGIEASVIYLLHMKEAYEFGIEEGQFINEMQEWYQQKNEELEYEKIVEAINHLYNMKTAKLENGKIFLKEKVWGKIE